VRGQRDDERAKDGQAVAAEAAVVRATPDRADSSARANLSARADRVAEFAALADRHLDSGYRLASVVLGDPTEAEDAAHDAAILAWRSFGSLRDRAKFEAWFCRIVLNVCRDRLRHRRRHQIVELRTDDENDLPRAADHTGAIVTRDAIDRAFADGGRNGAADRRSGRNGEVAPASRS
jgi:hypothetical protein